MNQTMLRCRWGQMLTLYWTTFVPISLFPKPVVELDRVLQRSRRPLAKPISNRRSVSLFDFLEVDGGQGNPSASFGTGAISRGLSKFRDKF